MLRGMIYFLKKKLEKSNGPVQARLGDRRRWYDRQATSWRRSMAESQQRVHVGSLSELAAAGRRVVKLGRKQIALFNGAKGVFACNNRCPHEGYPLVEGSLGEDCLLTCNWHNWKFDLASGETLVGQDRLRLYPVSVEEGELYLDLSDPPAEVRIAAALDSLHRAFRRDDTTHMAREIGRLAQAGGDPLLALRQALVWTHDRFEFGMTHALAAAPDWLRLGERHAGDEAERLVPLVEIVAHLNWDSLREPVYPYPEAVSAYDPALLLAAIEREDEVAAMAQLRGALAQGLDLADLEAPLAEAALAHYLGFGHAAIYLVKARQLVERLGPDSLEPVALAFLRALITARREDLIPEFRAYAPTLAAWEGAGGKPATAEDFQGLGVKQALARALESGAAPQALYRALLGAAAQAMLRFDLALQERCDNPVSQNVGWLDFSHALTFANAARQLCERHPRLWPAALLQIACFLGRNAAYVDPALETAPWRVADRDAFFSQAYRGLFDHRQSEHIVVAHLIKVLTAVEEEVECDPDSPYAGDLLAACNRFLTSPLKRRHSLREARQALAFVALED
jgi:nitrite reductase/ring-hydroxylating ferredoxin subunit